MTTVKKVYPWTVGDMTMRDYFAVTAVQGIITGGLSKGAGMREEDHVLIVKSAYQIADAMLKARANHG